MSNQLEMRFVSLADNVALARLAVAQMAAQAGFSLNEIEEIKVAVSEAVSNAVIHGYPDHKSGWITVECRVEGRELTIAIEDWGVGIADVEQARQPAFSSDPERMGLGFVFMDSFMHHVTVRSQVGRGTRVEMARNATVQEALTGDAQ
jgi:stage II sporulation protein AB (anti-sigma F factor)